MVNQDQEGLSGGGCLGFGYGICGREMRKWESSHRRTAGVDGGGVEG